MRRRGTSIALCLVVTFLMLGAPIGTIIVDGLVIDRTIDMRRQVDIIYGWGGGSNSDAVLSIPADAYVENASITMTGEAIELFDVFTDTGLDDFQGGNFDNMSFSLGNLLLSETDDTWTSPSNWFQNTLENVTIRDGVAQLDTEGGLEWSPDAMLTNNGAEVFDDQDRDSVDMALDGNGTIHVVYIDGNSRPYYSNSDDNGNDWSAPKFLVDQLPVTFIKIFVGPHDHLHIFFDNPADGGSTTYYMRSTNGGETFTQKTNWADTGLAAPYLPSVAWDAQGTMHVVATDITGGIPPFPQDVMYFNSTDDGKTFGMAVRVDDDPESYDNPRSHPQIAVDGDDDLHVVWLDGRLSPSPSMNDIFYANSSDHSTFSTNRKIDNGTGAYHESPRMAVDGNDKIHVIWADNRSSGRYDVRYTNSTNGGVGFRQDHVVNDDQSGNNTLPDLVIDPSNILHVTWQSWSGAKEYDVYYTISDDSGSTFDPSDRVDKSDTGNQTLPAIDFDKDELPHVVWKDNRMISTQIFHTHLFSPHLLNGAITGIADLGVFPKYFDVSTNAVFGDWTFVDVRIKTSPDKVVWTAWEDVELEDNLIDIPANRFVQYEISMRTQKDDLTPYINNITFGYHHYITKGVYTSETHIFGSDIPTTRAYWNGTNNGGVIGIDISNDNGTSWRPVMGKGVNITFDGSGNMLRYRITMTHYGNDTPILNDLTIHYGLMSEPSNIKVDVGHVGVTHFRLNGTFDSPVTLYITDQLNDYIAKNGISGQNVSIPLYITSATQGKVKVYNIKVIIDLPIEVRRYSPEEADPQVNETEKISFSIDVYDPDLKPLTYRWYFNDQIQAGATGSSWSLAAGAAAPGTYPVRVEVTDGRFSVNHTWDLDVVHINRPPVISQVKPVNSDLGILQPPLDNLSFSVVAVDPDNDPLTYTWKLSGNVIPGPDGNNYTWTEKVPIANDYVIDVVVSDGEFEVNQSWMFTIVKPKNNPPVIMSFEPKGLVEILAGSEQNFSINVMDVDKDPLTIEWYVDGNGTGTNDTKFTFRPEKEGTYTIKVLVSDGDLEASYEWSIDVAPKPIKPQDNEDSNLVWVMLAVIIIVVVVIFIVMTMMKRKGKGPEEAGEEDGGEGGGDGPSING